jgi:hypothetical protein
MFSQIAEGLEIADTKIKELSFESLCTKHIEPTNKTAFVFSNLTTLHIKCMRNDDTARELNHPGRFDHYIGFGKALSSAQPNLRLLMIDFGGFGPRGDDATTEGYHYSEKFSKIFFQTDSSTDAPTTRKPLCFRKLTSLSIYGIQVRPQISSNSSTISRVLTISL